MVTRSKSDTPRLTGHILRVSCWLFLVAPLLPAFEDDFEGYAVGSTAAWDVGGGAPVVSEATLPLFGSPNQSLDLTDSGRKILTSVASFASGGVTTFSCDFVELSGGVQSSGLQAGYAEASDINTAGGAVRVQLLGGMVQHVDLGGLSTLTQTGTLAYAEDQAQRLYIVVNDSAGALTDYQGDEDLAAGSYEVWLRSGPTLQHVLEATIGRTLNYAGFRTWSGFDSRFYVDLVRINTGVNLVPGNQGCSISSSHPAVAAGGTVTLGWATTGLSAGSTYEITSDGDVSFANGVVSGDIATGSGQVDATLNTGGAGAVTFAIQVRDPANQPICSSQEVVEEFDYSAPAQLPHPSVISNAGQLAFMRDQVLNHPGSLAETGWDAMLATPYASLDYVHTPQAIVSVVPSGTNASEIAFRNDTQAVRAHALQWVVTGDPAHRDKALAIASDMGRAFEQMVSTGSSAQTQLESAWALPVWLSAADILRYHDGGAANWDPADLASFHLFARKLYYHARLAMPRANNWGVSASLAVMAYGAWSDDPAIFESGFDNQLGLLDSISETDGEIAETCRDSWHPQYSVVSWIDSAELARNLGRLDLYEATFDGQATPRLAIILEYFANMMLGHTTHPCGGDWGYDYLGEYNRFDNYEVAYNHYLNRVGAAYLPVFAEMVEDWWRNDVGEDAHFFLWSRLTHGDNAWAALPPEDTYAQWAAQEFTGHGITDPILTAATADYNGDGITNGFHYWTLSNPREGAGESLVQALQADGSGDFRIRFVERPEAETYGRVFRFSSSLSAPSSTWSVVTPSSIIIVDDRGTRVVREASFPITVDRGFLVIGYPGP